MYPIEFVMVLFEQQILHNWKSLQSLQSNVAKPQLGALKLLLHFSCKEQHEWLDLIQMWGQNFNLLFHLLKELIFCSSSKMGPTVWALVRANFLFFSLTFMELPQFGSGIVHHVFSQHTSFQPVAISREHTACRYHAIEPMWEEEGPWMWVRWWQATASIKHELFIWRLQ